MAGRKPDYKLSFNDGVNFHRVGVAWVNESKTISIELDPFVQIPAGAKTKLVLIPSDYKPTPNEASES
jgi:hypothetical protein